MKRISLSERDATHVYEWLRMYWYPKTDSGGCYQCEAIGQRLEKLIGPQAVRQVKRDVRKHPK